MDDIVNSLSCAIIPAQLKLVSWTSPGTEKLKLKQMGAARHRSPTSCFQGLFREERVFRKFEDCTCLKAELWGHLRSFELIRYQGMTSAEVDSDSAVAVRMIKEDSPLNSAYRTLQEFR